MREPTMFFRIDGDGINTLDDAGSISHVNFDSISLLPFINNHGRGKF